MVRICSMCMYGTGMVCVRTVSVQGGQPVGVGAALGQAIISTAALPPFILSSKWCR